MTPRALEGLLSMLEGAAESQVGPPIACHAANLTDDLLAICRSSSLTHHLMVPTHGMRRSGFWRGKRFPTQLPVSAETRAPPQELRPPPASSAGRTPPQPCGSLLLAGRQARLPPCRSLRLLHCVPSTPSSHQCRDEPGLLLKPPRALRCCSAIFRLSFLAARRAHPPPTGFPRVSHRTGPRARSRQL